MSLTGNFRSRCHTVEVCLLDGFEDGFLTDDLEVREDECLIQ